MNFAALIIGDEILSGKFEAEVAELVQADSKKIRELYNRREIEPE